MFAQRTNGEGRSNPPPPGQEVDLRRDLLLRTFQVKDVLLKGGDPGSTKVSLNLQESFPSTGKILSTGKEAFLEFSWETKGLQGILPFLEKDVLLKEEFLVDDLYKKQIDQLTTENRDLRKQISLLQHKLGEYDRIISS